MASDGDAVVRGGVPSGLHVCGEEDIRDVAWRSRGPGLWGRGERKSGRRKEPAGNWREDI